MYTKKELRNIFQNRFDIESWKNILSDFFKFEGVRNDPQPLDMPNTDDKGFFLGKTITSEGLDLGFFQFSLASGNVLRKRVGLRRLVEPFLKYEIDAAIAVFDDGSHWRLSYISDFGSTATAPKRFTYTFGDPTQYYNTPINRLFDLQGTEIGAISLHEAFSVEALSKDFFDDYKKQYERFCDFVYQNKANADYFGSEFVQWEDKTVRDYVKKMMGRLVFLQYLQKKGWMGDNSNYLRQLFINSSQQDDFLDKVLEPLFFGVMNTKPADRPERFQNEGWDKSLLEEWKHIPFLSGGLFEQDKLDIPHSRFPKEYFGDLFDFFATYNFTIDENDPNDAEVGVDPEMLGKIFENLLEDNKDKGAFYTPKEIVRYMSCESIIQYLKSHTDSSLHPDIENLVNRSEVTGLMLNRDNATAVGKLLKQVKVCDPAIGSGAFPMGVLNVIYECRRSLMEQMTGETFPEPAKVKRGIIQNNIYGVDIEQGAVDIARLRFWLALVVDEKTPEELPNLDYKIMRGNSLITTFDGKYINLDESQRHADKNKIISKKEKLRELQSDYYSLTGEEKMKRDIEIKCLILDLIALQVGMEIRIWEEKNAQGSLFEKKTWEELKSTLPEDKRAVMDKGDLIRRHLTDESLSLQERVNTDLDFFDYEIMFPDIFDQNGGFDIVIGNPPYVSTKGVSIADKKIFEQSFGFSDDLYYLFTVRGLSILNNQGNLTFITPKTFWTTQTKKGMRDLLLSKNIIYIYDTANPFSSAMVDTCITQVYNSDFDQNHEIIFLDGSKNLNNPIVYNPIKQNVYIETQNHVIFKPTNQNMRIWEMYGAKVKKLYETWWDKIKTSKDIAKNKVLLEEYRSQLKPGDIALLGCLTDGGQGLATANNGKYIAVRRSTKWANNIILSRPKKLEEAIKKHPDILSLFKDASPNEFLSKASEKEIGQKFDIIKEKYGRDVFGQGYLYKIVDDEELAIVDELTIEEKENGIDDSKKYYVPYDKGDKDGNRWYLETPFAIAWTKDNVHFLKTNSGKKGEGMPVVRNSQFNFKEGFCWTDINSTYLKARLKGKGVFDVVSMSLFSQTSLPDYFFVCLINSEFISLYVDHFINNTSHFQINDARQVPIVIPNSVQLKNLEFIFQSALNVKYQKNKNMISEDQAEQLLYNLQVQLDKLVKDLYAI